MIPNNIPVMIVSEINNSLKHEDQFLIVPEKLSS